MAPDGKESACNVEDLGSIPGLGGSSQEGNGYPLEHSWASLVAQRVDPLEKGVATDSSILSWRIPWTEEPGELWSMGSKRVKHT